MLSLIVVLVLSLIGVLVLSLIEVVSPFALVQPLIKSADNNIRPIIFLLFIDFLSDIDIGIESYFKSHPYLSSFHLFYQQRHYDIFSNIMHKYISDFPYGTLIVRFVSSPKYE